MNWNGLNLLFSGLTGIPLKQNDFLKAGCRINRLERELNELMNGEDLKDSIPERFLTEKNTKFAGDQKIVPIDELIHEYKRLRSKMKE